MSCYQCPNHCIECISGNTCTRCVRGRYGTQCENTCRDTCLECVSASDCTECIHGRYGQYCQLYCPLGCIDILCDKDSGKCSRGCRPGYYISGEDCSRCPDHCTRCSDSEYCTICDSGYYGTDCQSACPLTCQNQVCDKERGICTEGCKEGYFFNDTVCISCPQKCTGCTNQNSCTECKTGYWGDLCQQECPTSCLRCEGEGQCIIGKYTESLCICNRMVYVSNNNYPYSLVPSDIANNIYNHSPYERSPLNLYLFAYMICKIKTTSLLYMHNLTLDCFQNN